MKRNLIFAVLLIVGLMQAFAQKDVTKYFLTNYAFDDNFDYTATQTTAVKQEIKEIPGWTQGFTHDYTISGVYEFGFAGTFNGAKVPAKGYDGEAGGGLALSTGWSCDFPYTQEITLPAGTYTIYAPSYNGCDKTDATSLLAWIPNSGTTVASTVTSYAANAWTNDQITFTLTATTTGKIRIGLKAAGGGSANSAKLVIDYVRIMGSDMTIDKSVLKELLSTATSLYGDGTGNDAATLKTAIDVAQKVYDDAAADLESVLTQQNELSAAIEEYKKQNASEENPLDYTSYIKNADFETKSFTGWTNTGFSLQSNTQFTKKQGTYYIEKWVSKGSAVGDASITQILTNLPNGKYKLTVAAQNLNQNATTQKCEGAWLYAGDQQTTVTTPATYAVTFTSISGQMEVGFRAEGATGNWLALDDFKLYLIGSIDADAVFAELQRIIQSAETLQQHVMSVEAATTLSAALAEAKALTVTSESADIQSATNTLNEAISVAQTSVAQYDQLSADITDAEALTGQYMQTTVLEALNAKISAAKAIDGTSTDAQVTAATTALESAITAAKSSVSSYASLQSVITEANALYDNTLEGAEALTEAIATAQALYDARETDDTGVAAAVKTLQKAMLAFHLANATAGTGTAPRVTSTNHYVPTGATQAMMRFVYTGSNILEHGVCWSTEHEPTVLDERCTSTYSVNGLLHRLVGLTPATVYYIRPYVMNKTYTVAYGDEVKIVTHRMGNCTWSWNNGAPTAEANTRCRNAIKQTIDFFNEWTGIQGFKLSGTYGSGTPTADCGYGGSMRIGPSSAYQAIGTVIHETGHGVGVGTTYRWYSCSDTRANTTNGKWLGREANDMLQFLENKEGDSDCYMTGDGTHGWGHNATYDWFVNGADKDKHTDIQYIGGCCLLYGLFIDGLCPTSSYKNGLSGYTYNFDDETRYYIMPKSDETGLGDGLLYQRTTTAVAWKPFLSAGEEVSDSAAWFLEYNPKTCYYAFRNAATGKYLTHTAGSTSVTLKSTTNVTTTENFQLMPDRTDVTLTGGSQSITTHGYWFTWNDGSNKSMSAATKGKLYGVISQADFNFSNSATRQQWIIIPESELAAYQQIAVATGIQTVTYEEADDEVATPVYNLQGQIVSHGLAPLPRGIYIRGGRKVLVR